MQPEQMGPFRIVRLLGRGGMGAVYEGVNTETGEPAAIKGLAPGLARESDFRQRFEVEIETLRKLRHPNIVRLLAFGEQDGQLYYAMELVPGQSLEEELHRGRRFDWRETTVIGIQTCRALRHAHDRGIIHRDIKPANLMMTPDGQVKLSDFGIARLFGITRLTTAGNVLGSVEYMAPEQADARPVDPRCDLYSLGGVLFALLAGRAPFKARSIPEMLDLQRSARPDPVSRYAFGVPEELERIIAELLEKDPNKRIANAMILGRRLEAMLHGLSLSGGVRAGTKASATDTDFDVQPPSGEPDRTEIFGLPPTRTVGGASEASAHSFQAAVPADNLPETRETSAFAAFGAEASTTAEPEPAPKPADRFVVVPEEELDQGEEEAYHPPLVSPQTWVLAAALLMIGLTVWYFLRPLSADKLYSRISAATSDGSIESLLAARDDIDAFLARYSDDPRAAKLREYAREIELDDLEKAFYVRMNGPFRATDMLPIQRACQEAWNYARIDPELSMLKLQAVLDLYGSRGDGAGPTGQCLELARRRLKLLQEQLKGPNEDFRTMVLDRLDHADQLRGTDPERARQMWQAILELYAQKPWAADLVRRARESLAALPPAQPGGGSPAAGPPPSKPKQVATEQGKPAAAKASPPTNGQKQPSK